MPNPQILIVGAGPSGLVLALSLARQGVAFRIVDRADGPGTQSRAMAVQARTLEFYAQFGIAAEVVGEGIVADTMHLREREHSGRSRELLQVSFDDMGRGISPYPFILTYPQDLHERLLLRALDRLGVAVERNTTLEQLQQDADAATVTLRGPGGVETARFDHVCGCDGAHSAVRTALDIGFSGGTYEQPFYVADAKVDGAAPSHSYMNLGERLLALVLPVRMTGMHRLIGLIPPHLVDKPELSFEDLRAEVEELIGFRVGAVNWFSRYRVHHRVADRFRLGRAFLLGDAGHVHSPVGGQGMNTGIGDAINLGWKLAASVSGRADPSVLDTYETERIAFGRSLVATTDRVFGPIIAPGLKGTVTRRLIAPLVASIAASTPFTRRAVFRTVSQTKIAYPDSALSEGRAGTVAGGDRLPFVADGDNFAPLASLDWQVHVYGEAHAPLLQAVQPLGLPVHRFAWSDAAADAGLQQGAAYLVRPDGYVGLAADAADPAPLRRYVERWGIRTRDAATRPG